MTCVIMENYTVFPAAQLGKAAPISLLSSGLMPLNFPKRCTESLSDVSSCSYESFTKRILSS